MGGTPCTMPFSWASSAWTYSVPSWHSGPGVTLARRWRKRSVTCTHSNMRARARTSLSTHTHARTLACARARKKAKHSQQAHKHNEKPRAGRAEPTRAACAADAPLGDDSKATPLMLAAALGLERDPDAEVVKALLDGKADPLLEDSNGYTVSISVALLFFAGSRLREASGWKQRHPWRLLSGGGGGSCCPLPPHWWWWWGWGGRGG